MYLSKKANKLKLRIVGFSLNKISTHLCLLCLQARREKWGKRECKVQQVSLAPREIEDLKVGLDGIMEKVTLFKAWLVIHGYSHICVNVIL